MQDGLSLNVGGFGGVRQRGAPQFGTQTSYSPPTSATSAAFSDGLTPTYSGANMGPGHPVGLFFCIGVGSVIALAILRYSLPN